MASLLLQPWRLQPLPVLVSAHTLSVFVRVYVCVCVCLSVCVCVCVCVSLSLSLPPSFSLPHLRALTVASLPCLPAFFSFLFLLFFQTRFEWVCSCLTSCSPSHPRQSCQRRTRRQQQPQRYLLPCLSFLHVVIAQVDKPVAHATNPHAHPPCLFVLSPMGVRPSQ